MSLMLGIVEDIEDTILLFLVCKSGVCVFSGARGSVAKGNEMRRACGTTRRAKSDGRHTAGSAAEAEAVCVCVFPFRSLRSRSSSLEFCDLALSLSSAS
jgi:hypothetical protein